MSAVPADRSLTTQIPLFVPPPRSRADVDVHALSIPARGFTGDFYFTRRQGDTLWIALGDVAGKGLNAAVIMAMIQEELEHRITSCSRSDCDPATTMTRLHSFLRTLLPDNKFATGVIAQLHDSGRLRIVNAGHPPALISRRDGSIEEISSTGPVAGLLPQSSWRSTTLQLDRGDALVLYTDGVTEARDGVDELGVNGLKNVLAEARGSSRQIASSIQRALREHHRDDDFTLFVAKR